MIRKPANLNHQKVVYLKVPSYTVDNHWYVQLVDWENTSVSYGTVTIGNDATQLYVTYDAAPGDSDI